MSKGPPSRIPNRGNSISRPLRKTFWLLRQTGANWVQDNAMRLSAAVSFYTFLSLAPLLIIAGRIIHLVWKGQSGPVPRITQQTTEFIGTPGAQAIGPAISGDLTGSKSFLALTVTACVLFFSASAVFVELQDAMNTIWGATPRPHEGLWRFFRTRVLSLGMILCVVFLLVMWALINEVLTDVGRQEGINLSAHLFPLKDFISFVVEACLFAVIFKVLPDTKVNWSDVWLGSLIAAILFSCGRIGLAIYFRHARGMSLYGAASSVVAVLLWVYYSAFSLFFGVEFTKTWRRRHGGGAIARTKPNPR